MDRMGRWALASWGCLLDRLVFSLHSKMVKFYVQVISKAADHVLLELLP